MSTVLVAPAAPVEEGLSVSTQPSSTSRSFDSCYYSCLIRLEQGTPRVIRNCFSAGRCSLILSGFPVSQLLHFINTNDICLPPCGALVSQLISSNYELLGSEYTLLKEPGFLQDREDLCSDILDKLVSFVLEIVDHQYDLLI